MPIRLLPRVARRDWLLEAGRCEVSSLVKGGTETSSDVPLPLKFSKESGASVPA